jgi:hypothetical protein
MAKRHNGGEKLKSRINIAGKHDTFSRNSKKYSGGLDYIIYGD